MSDRIGGRACPKGWRWRVATMLGIVAAGLPSVAQAAAATPQPAATARPGSTVGVVVMSARGVAGAEQALRSVGGRSVKPLGIVHGASAQVPGGAVAALTAAPSVTSVSLDHSLRALGNEQDQGDGSDADLGSTSSVSQMAGVQKLWAAGLTGRGVDVALIDTGVARVQGLDDHQVIDGPDLSFDYQAGGPAGVDAFGHGTHMAGIIAGRDPGVTADGEGCDTCLNSSGFSDSTKFVGMAPESRLVNVKVGASNGATDVSQVIAAIDWVVQHRNDNGLNIKVINLSYGTTSQNAYGVDPLAYASEVAWRNGLLVVAAGGNDGISATSLASPAYDPLVLAVGADDPMGTRKLGDDTVPDFASHGSSSRSVDVIAPGVHMVSLRVPGSYVDTTYGDTGQVGDRFFRGSGTSQAAAVVSGLAADLYQRWPNATPDQIKQAITGGARPLKSSDESAQGHGLINGRRSLEEGLQRLPKSGVLQNWEPSTGLGSLEASRGGAHVAIDGIELTGERDIFGQQWDGQRWSADAWSGTSWTGGVWEGQRWSGDGWDGQRWSDAAWTGSDWTGQRWSGQRWSGQRWSGQRWSGQRWSGQRWSGQRWSEGTWSSGGWG